MSDTNHAHVTMPRIRIVVADDHEIVRVSLLMLLTGEPDLEVVGVGSNAREAAELVRGQRPDVLVLDLNMPGESGLALIPRLQRDVPETKIVVLTMQREPGFARQALGSGAVAYVLKDAADRELVQAVRNAACDRHRVDPKLGAQLMAPPAGPLADPLSERSTPDPSSQPSP